VHDELLVEAPIGFGSLEEFQDLITTLPDWAQNLPVAAKVRNGERFCKSEKSAPSAGHLGDGPSEITRSSESSIFAKKIPRQVINDLPARGTVSTVTGASAVSLGVRKNGLPAPAENAYTDEVLSRALPLPCSANRDMLCAMPLLGSTRVAAPACFRTPGVSSGWRLLGPDRGLRETGLRRRQNSKGRH
jgi:hypothetical protein